MALPKCRDCGIRLTTLKEINGYNGYCEDCFKKGQKYVGIVYGAIAVIVVLLLYWIF